MKKMDDFQAFWNAYALKRDRIAAERAWKKLSAKDRKAAFDGIDRYSEDCKKRGISRMYAQGYITHRRWEDEECADESKGAVMAETDAAPVVCSSVRSGERLTEQDLQTFADMKTRLLEAWSRHRNEPNASELHRLLDELALDGVDDFHKTVVLCGQRMVFNRYFTVPWFWDPEEFDRIVAEHFNGYRWRAFP